MANPNLINMTSLLGNVAGQSIGTSMANIVENASSSGKIFRVHSLIISNIDGTNAAQVSAQVQLVSTNYKIAHTVTVPPDATLILVGRDSPIYLTENSRIQLQASAASDLQAVCSFDELS